MRIAIDGHAEQRGNLVREEQKLREPLAPEAQERRGAVGQQRRQLVRQFRVVMPHVAQKPHQSTRGGCSVASTPGRTRHQRGGQRALPAAPAQPLSCSFDALRRMQPLLVHVGVHRSRLWLDGALLKSSLALATARGGRRRQWALGDADVLHRERRGSRSPALLRAQPICRGASCRRLCNGLARQHLERIAHVEKQLQSPLCAPEERMPEHLSGLRAVCCRRSEHRREQLPKLSGSPS
mmetsp:Transcript_2897/g.6572  ORF Transcript_2897/g.6572 Transcript_2897/m.6572 type:complete len:238 (+) Transcript_2897:378-1091(+)